MGETPKDPGQGAIPLDDLGLIRVLEDLPARPLLAGEDGLRLSLAGAQSKVPVVLVDGAIALPALGQPTTHILKLPIARFAATTENEAFTMRLAKATGLSVATVEARVVRERPFLLVERYDRRERSTAGCAAPIKKISARRSGYRRRGSTKGRADPRSEIASRSCAALPPAARSTY